MSDVAPAAPQKLDPRTILVRVLSVTLCLFVLVEANYPLLKPEASKSLFVMLGLVLCYLLYPATPRLKEVKWLRWADALMAVGVVLTCGYIVVQTQPMFSALWLDGRPLSQRAGQVTGVEFWLAVAGLALVIEATRRSIGSAVPILSLIFVAYAYYGPELPDWAFPHRGVSLEGIIEKSFLQSEGVFGLATGVMFKYVFLFVVFGAFLEVTGATQFIIDFSKSIFGASPGGPAKVSVLGSGLMGSLSGSAVANAVTTGAFTIPMMRSAGFKPHTAAGITAAAAAGGALVPPVMGAAAYMMLDIGIRGVTGFLDIAKAAVIPSVLYYLSIFMIVHFFSRKLGATAVEEKGPKLSPWKLMATFEGVVFFGALTALIWPLVVGLSPARAVTISLGVTLALGFLHPRKRITLAMIMTALVKSARGGVSLIAASACVGILIAMIDRTGVGSMFGSAIKSVVESNLLLALFGIMCASLILGMGVPSVVCYLLLATMMGAMLDTMGVIPLAGHMFIFYFGMMSMVTPPVALAAYASASIADAPIIRSSWSSFVFALVGFTLPYMFVYRPELLLLAPDGSPLGWEQSGLLVEALFAAVIGVVGLAAGLAGYLMTRLRWWTRGLLFLSSALLLVPTIRIGESDYGLHVNIAGWTLFAVVLAINWRRAAQERAAPAPAAAPVPAAAPSDAPVNT